MIAYKIYKPWSFDQVLDTWPIHTQVGICLNLLFYKVHTKIEARNEHYSSATGLYCFQSAAFVWTRLLDYHVLGQTKVKISLRGLQIQNLTRRLKSLTYLKISYLWKRMTKLCFLFWEWVFETFHESFYNILKNKQSQND